MQFSQIIGQAATAERLVHMAQQQRVSHALLFLGKEGSGALSLARAFAQYMVCEWVQHPHAAAAAPSLFGDTEPAPAIAPNDSCGICPACIKAATLIHPDIHYAYPTVPSKPGDKPISTDYIKEWREFVKSTPYGNNYDWLQFIKAENRQGNITSRECEDILHKMSLKSFEAGYKILIMWMPELLGKEGNKLLKLIEEPPPGSLFLFVAENDEFILPTILSRTQLIKIPMLSSADIEQALVETGMEPRNAAQIAALSEGNYHEALQQVAHAGDDWDLLLRDWLNSIIKTGPAAQVKWIDGISKIGREKQKQFLAYFIHILEMAVQQRFMPAAGEEQTTVQDFAGRFNKLCSVEQQEAISQELEQAIYHIERNANAKMLFHALSIKLYHIIKNKSVILVR